MRPAWIVGLWAVGLLAAGCAGTPAPRPSAEDAGVSEAVEVPRQVGDGDRRPPAPVPRRVERPSQRRDDPKPSRDEPVPSGGEPTTPVEVPAPPRPKPAATPPEDGPRAPSAPSRSTPPSGGGPTTPPRDDPACPEPEVVTERADVVHDAAIRPGPAASGFAGLALSAADCRIDLWWKGPVPPRVAAAVEPIDGVDGMDGVHVVTHAAAHSAAELATAADVLTAERVVTLPDQAAVTVAVEAVTPRYDGAGVDVEISVEPRRAGRGLAEQVAASLTERAGVPVAVEVVANPPAALGGGERSYHPVPDRPGELTACTTGFEVRARDGGEGRWLLTADHCTGGADGPAFDGAHAPMGAVTEHRPALDSTRIAVDGPVGDDRTLVRGAAANYPGKSVCHAGASSGEVCDLVIRQVDRRQWSEALGTYVHEVVLAERTHGRPAARPGDSGAPVYQATRAGDTDALGIVVMGPTGDPRSSPLDTIYYVDIRALLAEWHADLEPASSTGTATSSDSPAPREPPTVLFAD